MSESPELPENDPGAADREVIAEELGLTDPAEGESESESGEGGSGTAGSQTPEKEQAGSYARDAEQDPARERHDRADADG